MADLETNVQDEADKKGLTGEAKQQYVGGTIHNIKKRAFKRKNHAQAVAEWEQEHGKKYNWLVDGPIQTNKEKEQEEKRKQKEEKQRKQEEHKQKIESLEGQIDYNERGLARLKQHRDNVHTHNRQLKQKLEKEGNKKTARQIQKT